MTKLRRLLRNVPFPRFGAAAVTAGVLIVVFRGVESRGLPWYAITSCLHL